METENNIDDVNSGLMDVLKGFESQIRSTSPESPAILLMMRNWLIPILSDFGTAINSIAVGLSDVGQIARDAQSTADMALSNELLDSAGAIASEMSSALASGDSDKINSMAALLVDLLADWVEDPSDGAVLADSEP
jgi:hypothetical protein